MARSLQGRKYGVNAITHSVLLGFKIVILSRHQAGKHSNQYVKIRKGNKVVAKYVFGKGWESECDLSESSRSALQSYLVENEQAILTRIKELG